MWFFDPAATGLGVAIGLVELGHRVTYHGPEPWPDEDPGLIARLRAELAARFFGAPGRVEEPDLLVVWDGIADALHARRTGQNADARFDPARPLRDTTHPAVGPLRLALWRELAHGSGRTVVVDCSDRRAPGLAEVFASWPRTTCCAREVAAGDRDGAVRPLPFLYNPALLWLEKMRPRDEWVRPRRSPELDWAFCGTLQHARYGGARRRLLDEVRARWPALRGATRERCSFLEVLDTLQSARLGLDLPGGGELCFRVHECLALALPILRPWPFEIAMAPGLDRAVVADPAHAPAREEVQRVYEECYQSRVAAEVLLARTG